MRRIVLRSATRSGLTRRDYWLAAGAADVVDDVVLRAVDDRVELAALALGHAELREGLVEVVHERIPLRAGDQRFAIDVTDRDSFSDFLDQVERQLGPIDVLVNNAGIMPVGKIIDEPDAVTQRILDINVYGVMLGSKLAAQRMVPRGQGHVINVASLAGEIYAVGLATYCASKHAVVAFTDSARLECRSAGVKFSMVLPSFVDTELTAGTQGAKGFRNAEPSEIADAIVGLVVHPKPRVRVTKAAGVSRSWRRGSCRA